jgi:hypothetical protein
MLMKSATVFRFAGLGILHSSGLSEASIGVINGREISSKADDA